MNLRVVFIVLLLVFFTSCNKTAPEVKRILASSIDTSEKSSSNSNNTVTWNILTTRETCLSSDWKVLKNTSVTENTYVADNNSKTIIYTCELHQGKGFINRLTPLADRSIMLISSKKDREIMEKRMNLAKFEFSYFDDKLNYADSLNKMKLPYNEFKQKLAEFDQQRNLQKNKLKEELNQVEQAKIDILSMQSYDEYIKRLKAINLSKNIKVKEQFVWVIANNGDPEFKRWKVSARSPNDYLSIWNIYQNIDANIPISVASYQTAENYINILQLAELKGIVGTLDPNE